MKKDLSMNIHLKKIHDECGWHDEAILKSKICGCFHCLSIFPPGSIKKWIDERDDCPRGPGKTAVCPNCGIDAVLPDTIDHEITKDFLAKMQNEFF